MLMALMSALYMTAAAVGFATAAWSLTSSTLATVGIAVGVECFGLGILCAVDDLRTTLRELRGR